MVKKNEMPSDYRLWVAIRKLENSWRFVGDMYLGLVKEIKAVNPAAVLEDILPPSFGTNPPGPIPPCRPPLCVRELAELRDFTNSLAQDAVAMADALDQVYDLAHDLDLENIHFQPTQLPVAPEGTNVEEVGTEHR